MTIPDDQDVLLILESIHYFRVLWMASCFHGHLRPLLP